MARPPANPEGPRSIRRGVPLTPGEDAAIVAAAGGRPVAEWMREVVLDAARIAAPKVKS